MHVQVDDLPKRESPKKKKNRKLILIVSIVGFLLCIGIGIYVLFSSTPIEQNIDLNPPPQLHFNTNFSYDIGIIPAAYNQHLVKITHRGGDPIDDMSQSLWITIYPPDSTPYERRTSIIHTSKYLDFVEDDILYIYLGKDQRFYASKELPEYESYVDLPNGNWGIHIDDARYKVPISDFKFTIENSKTHLVNTKSNTRISDIIDTADAFDTIYIKGDQVYHEQLTITDKPIRLYSLDGAVIDAGGSNSVITIVNSSYSEIHGFNIINSGTKAAEEAGILLRYSYHISIKNNTIHNNQNGIYLIGSENNDIRYNNLYLNDISGVTLALNSDSNTVKENMFQLNTIGIYIKDSSNTNYVVKNTGHDNTRYGILIDNKLKNIYEYNDFGYDRMSYDKVVEQNMTTYSEEKSNWDDWYSTCGSHESADSPACKGVK